MGFLNITTQLVGETIWWTANGIVYGFNTLAPIFSQHPGIAMNYGQATRDNMWLPKEQYLEPVRTSLPLNKCLQLQQEVRSIIMKHNIMRHLGTLYCWTNQHVFFQEVTCMAPILYIVSIAVCEFHLRGSPEMSSGQLRWRYGSWMILTHPHIPWAIPNEK
jgi:hypothetical protein